MPILQSLKSNVFFGLSSAIVAIYVYNNYDNLPSVNDMKTKFSNKFLINNDNSENNGSGNDNPVNDNPVNDISGNDDLMRPESDS
tara:strand:- start:330 stop:584 length:255 start_codon:yes stop_codon:yes gene_type:complete